MTISFNSIPVAIRTPGQYVEFDSSQATGGLPPALTHSDPRSVDPADVGQLLALILAEIAKGQDEVSVLF